MPIKIATCSFKFCLNHLTQHLFDNSTYIFIYGDKESFESKYMYKTRGYIVKSQIRGGSIYISI